MDGVVKLAEIVLDAGLLALCCEGMFRERETRRARDLLLFPAFVLFFMAARLRVTVGAEADGLLASEGFDLLPADHIALVLFLILAVLVADSVCFRPGAEMDVFCRTMAAFSLFLLTKTGGFMLCAASGFCPLRIFPRLLAFAFMTVIFCSPASGWMRERIGEGGVAIFIVSVDIAAAIIAVGARVPFDSERSQERLSLWAALLALLLLFDVVLLHAHARTTAQRRHIRMVEQYVPVVEELISQVRARQHEFQNRLFAIDAALAAADTLDEARENVAALTKSALLEPRDRELLACESKIISGMLYGKIRQAQARGVEMDVTLHGLFKKGKTSETDWIEVIGILVDNACEASREGDVVSVAGRQTEAGIELLVSNPSAPFSNTEFMHLFKRGVTSKEGKDAHGFGLSNVMRIVEKYHGSIITRNETVDGRNYVVFGVVLP